MESSFVDEREDVQKKTFAKWINSQLVKNDKPLVEDLFLDLRDGEILLSLLEILTAQQYKRERGRMRVHHINNVNTALGVLEANGVKLVNISSNDVVDGNPKLILGLVWSIILHWQVHYHLKELMSELHHTNLEKTLLAWCRAHTQNYAGVNVKNFTTSWSDGLALNALLHRWRPQLFDFRAVAARSARARLEHAFSLAHERLGIAPLLDPEDVNTAHPDKKSIMTYLMCLFQSLPHSGDDVAELAAEPSEPSEPSTPQATDAPVELVCPSRPLSTATTGSAELGGYYAAFEEVLAWLLEAEERLQPALESPADLHQVKEHFHSHERFLLEVAEQQSRVGGVLEQGTRLVLEAGLSREEAGEVRLQVRLLNQRWERLRAAAMRTQALLHAALMRHQQDQLDGFRQWLTRTEDRISRMGPVSSARDAVATQLQAARALHAELQEMQAAVDALADCIVIVVHEDEQHPDNVAQIEDELRALSERWAHTCVWCTARVQRLSQLHARWTQLDARHDQLHAAQGHLHASLQQMEANPVSEVGAVLERIAALQRIKHECSVQQRNVAAHMDAVAALTGEGDEPAEAGAAGERAEALQDELDALLMILDVQASRIKELGFEFDMNTTETSSSNENEDGTITTTSTVTVTTSPPARERDPSSSAHAKKPRLDGASADFQVGYKAFEDWAAAAENTLQRCLETVWSGGSGHGHEQAGAIVDRIDKEIEAQRADFANVEEIQRRLAAEAGLEEDAARHLESISALKQRWEHIRRLANEARAGAAAALQLAAFRAALPPLHAALADVRQWRARLHAQRPTNALLVHLRNKIRQTKQLEMKLKEVNAQSIILLTKPIPKADQEDVDAETKRINDEYEDVLLDLTKKEVEMKVALNRKPSAKHEDEFKSLQSRIQAIEAQVIAEHAMVSDRELMQDKVEELSSLRREFDELQSTYDAVVRDRRDLYEKGSVQELDFRSSLENLVTRFADSKTILDTKISKLRNGMVLVQRLEEQSRDLVAWLDTLQHFVADNAYIPVGEVELLDALLDSSNKFDEQKQTYKSKLESIESTKESVLEDCSDALAKSLHSETALLRKRFDTTTNDAFKLNENLRRALERTEGVFRKMDEIEKWLQQIEEQIPKEDECNITDSAELYKMKTHFQALKDKCDDKTQEFRNLNEASNDILLAAEGAQPAALVKRVTHLNARWTAVMHGVYERYKVLAEAWHETGELRAWLTQETAWLDGLQRRLRCSPTAPVDAEDIAHELTDLENYVQNHSDARLSRIQDVGRQLADALIMPAWIQAEVDAVTDRWIKLKAEAESRGAVLERQAREAARSEVSVDTLHQWLDDVSAALDPAAAHPPDVQKLQEQFGAQRALVEEVERQADAYRSAGNPEAAARLTEQLQLVQRKFNSLERRVQALRGAEGGGGAGGDVPARLAAALGALGGVQRACAAALPLAGAEPDALRAQLRACLKFYRTLSEIKSEVESIIKTGRKMVEEATVAEPQEFSKKIDSLKELYNKLGAQITESKGKLESALLRAREIQNDVHALTAWLDQLPHQPHQPGPQSLELEMSRMEAVRDKLNKNYAEFAANCDPAHLERLRAQVDGINARWERLKRHGLARRGHDLDALHERLDALAAPLDAPEPSASAQLRTVHHKLRDLAPEVDALDDKALAERYHHILERVAREPARPARPSQEYENVTDTIKRRLDSPVDAPETERPDFKKSKIPLALKSPIPIKREIKESGNRSRGSSLERGKRPSESPAAESVGSAISTDSMEPSSSALSSIPTTPDTPKDSSTFNLLKDSDLFTQISKNKIEANPSGAAPVPAARRAQPCQVVNVKEHEIMKSTVSPLDPDPYPFEAIDAVVEFVPRRAETVRVLDGTESETETESGETDAESAERRSVDLGSEPRTFVVEVKTLEQRMRPTLGVLKRRSAEEARQERLATPDLIPARERDADGPRTPPPTPLDEADVAQCPLLYDLAVRKARDIRRDEHDEYLILDAVPRDQAALPEPSFTAEAQAEPARLADGANEKAAAAVHMLETINETSAALEQEDEVIYSEVEDVSQLRMSAAVEVEDAAPLSTSTPIKPDTKAQVVAMSPKLTKLIKPDQTEKIDQSNQPEHSDQPRNKEPKSPLPKSHIPISKERLKSVEKYQRTDDVEKIPGPECRNVAETAAPSALTARFGAECDQQLVQFEADAESMSRRLNVVLLTVAGVNVERDPGKRLEILKNQLGSVAPDAAALISRGDSLVYDTHKHNPLLADYIQTHFQDKLRNKWSLVMSEVESKRHLALAAEDNIKELSLLLPSLQKCFQELDTKLNENQAELVVGEMASAESSVERVQELCRELRTARAGFPERAAADLLQRWTALSQRAAAAGDRAHQDGASARCGEYVTHANLARSLVARVTAALHAHPLGGKDYDDFPLQEEALQRVKESLSEVQSSIEQSEQEYANAVRACGGEGAARCARVRDKLHAEGAALQRHFAQRYDKWSSCQSVWAALYAALESCGEWLDSAERALDHCADTNLPTKDLKQKLRDIEKQMSSRQRVVSSARAQTRAVVSACGAALARDVQDQMDLLNERWHAVGSRHKALQQKVAAQESSSVAQEGGSTWAAQSMAQLQQVRELLDTTSPNSSDSTSLAIRTSLVK